MVSANTKQGQYKRQGIGKDESICSRRKESICPFGLKDRENNQVAEDNITLEEKLEVL